MVQGALLRRDSDIFENLGLKEIPRYGGYLSVPEPLGLGPLYLNVWLLPLDEF